MSWGDSDVERGEDELLSPVALPLACAFDCGFAAAAVLAAAVVVTSL